MDNLDKDKIEKGTKKIEYADGLFNWVKKTFGHQFWCSPNRDFVYDIEESVEKWLIGYLENKMDLELNAYNGTLKNLGINIKVFDFWVSRNGRYGSVTRTICSLEDLCNKCSEYDPIFNSILEKCKIIQESGTKNTEVKEALEFAKDISDIIPIVSLREKIIKENE
jgi:hypothetical protein